MTTEQTKRLCGSLLCAAGFIALLAVNMVILWNLELPHPHAPFLILLVAGIGMTLVEAIILAFLVVHILDWWEWVKNG